MLQNESVLVTIAIVKAENRPFSKCYIEKLYCWLWSGAKVGIPNGKKQKRVNLAELEKCCKISTYLVVVKIGFDTAENEPSKVWVTGIPVYRYRHCRTGISQAKLQTNVDVVRTRWYEKCLRWAGTLPASEKSQPGLFV